jgi:hypothetical protein
MKQQLLLNQTLHTQNLSCDCSTAPRSLAGQLSLLLKLLMLDECIDIVSLRSAQEAILRASFRRPEKPSAVEILTIKNFGDSKLGYRPPGVQFAWCSRLVAVHRRPEVSSTAEIINKVSLPEL